MPTVLITGGHGGIGLEASRQLASAYGLNLLLAGRSPATMAAAAAELRSAHSVAVDTIELDTSSLASVRAAAARTRELLASGQIDSLVAIAANAGARQSKLAFSVDGYEQTFATNYLGHFLLIELLTDALAARGRIVLTASGTHDPETTDGRMAGRSVRPDAVALASTGKAGGRRLHLGQLYSTSKLCMVMHAYELDRRLRRNGSAIEAIAYDPGFTSGTGFLDDMPRALQRLADGGRLDRTFARLGVTMGSKEFSGQSLARVIADPAFEGHSGTYLQSDAGRLFETRSSRLSYDFELARTLWTDSVSLVGLQPGEECSLLR